jgi:hypothetical protein
VANLSTTITGNVNAALYAMSGSTPGALLGTCTALTNPVNGLMTFTLTSSVPVTKGVPVFIAIHSNASPQISGFSYGNLIYAMAQTYASGFPASMAGYTNVSTQLGFAALGITITNTTNNPMVSEPQQDGLTTYVSDSTVGHADFYTIGAITSTALSTVAVVTRGFMQKSDAGVRAGAVQIKSGATTVASSTLSLSTSFQWAWRIDLTDPNTGAAWTAANVSAVQIGPLVVA